MTTLSETENRILDAAVRHIAAKPWPRIALADIAMEAGLPIGEVYRLFSSKHAILRGLHRRIDLEMLAAPLDDGPIRDRLFDLLMRRFDALAPLKPAFKTGISEVRGGRLGTLEAALASATGVRRSMTWALEAAGIRGTCLTTLARSKLLALAYLSVFRVWLEDASIDLAATMAALDTGLTRVWPFLAVTDSAPPVPPHGPDNPSPLPA